MFSANPSCYRGGSVQILAFRAWNILISWSGALNPFCSGAWFHGKILLLIMILIKKNNNNTLNMLQHGTCSIIHVMELGKFWQWATGIQLSDLEWWFVHIPDIIFSWGTPSLLFSTKSKNFCHTGWSFFFFFFYVFFSLLMCDHKPNFCIFFTTKIVSTEISRRKDTLNSSRSFVNDQPVKP